MIARVILIAVVLLAALAVGLYAPDSVRLVVVVAIWYGLLLQLIRARRAV